MIMYVFPGAKTTAFADKLSIHFDSKLESMEQVIASGNILASDGEKKR